MFYIGVLVYLNFYFNYQWVAGGWTSIRYDLLLLANIFHPYFFLMLFLFAYSLVICSFYWTTWQYYRDWMVLHITIIYSLCFKNIFTGISCNTKKPCHVNRWYQHCVISNRLTHSLAVRLLLLLWWCLIYVYIE